MGRLWLAALLAALAAANATADSKVYPNRWVYVSRGLHKHSDVAEIRDIVRTAAEHGLNGMVLATGWDRLDLQPPHFFGNSLEYDKVRVHVEAWGGRSGKFWVDDLKVEEVGLVNVLRRPGTPVAVKGEASGTAYEEGKDFAPIADPRLNFRFDHDGPAIKLLPGTRIAEGERLRVSYYHGIAINRGQVSVCMSEPKLYEIWREQVRLVRKHLAPAKWLLSMDEVRAGGSCEACKSRRKTMGEILGDCITRQFQMIREASPKAEVYCWSDMLDPNHNAHGDYYLVEGDFARSWEHVPKELVIVCWYYDKREASLAHFSRLA